MTHKKTARGITPKTQNKMRYIITAMIAGMRPEQFEIWMRAGGFTLEDAVQVGTLRWTVKMKIASDVYHAVIEKHKDIEYAERYKVRSLVQLVVMKALRHAESDQPIPWDSIEAEARAYNAIKLGLPEDIVTDVINTARQMLTTEVINAVKQAMQKGELPVEVGVTKE